MNIDLSLYDATLIPSIIFILYILGNSGVPRRVLPAVALVLGVIAGLVFIEFGPEGVIAGILLAATVVGSHSGTKNIKQAFQRAPTHLNTLIGKEIEIPQLKEKFKISSVASDGSILVKQVTSGLS
jgi:hypothetical protein